MVRRGWPFSPTPLPSVVASDDGGPGRHQEWAPDSPLGGDLPVLGTPVLDFICRRTKLLSHEATVIFVYLFQINQLK